MNKKALSERDICTKYITPALKQAGWDEFSQIREEVGFTKGRIRQFIHLSLISPLYQKIIDEAEVGVSREGLSMQRLRLFPMLILPLAEQHRIVAKVDELMARCDRLEAQLATTQTQSRRLLEATLHQALQPSGCSVSVAL
jgi:type I restriction enzyme S subunit